MNALKFAYRLLQRDWRSNELRLMVIAVIVAVAAVTAVGFFTDRVQQALELQATELLAADLVIESTTNPPREFLAQAGRLGLNTVLTLTFPSVVLHEDAPHLVQVKAVGPGYPLRGRLRAANHPAGPEHITANLPEPGEAWAERRLFALLGVDSGTSLSLGEKGFTLSRVLIHEPDRGWNLFRLAPRVLIRFEDVAATELVTPASRVAYRLLLAGEPSNLATYREWVKPRLTASMELVDIATARPEMRNALEQGGRFLSLAAIVSVMLAGAAVALSANRFVERQADASAIFRCLGASRGLVLRVFLFRLAGVGLIASLLGCVLGFFAQYLLAELVGHWFARTLPSPSPGPILSGLAAGNLTLFGFALPPLLRLGRVSPLRALRRDLRLVSASSRMVLGSAALAIGTLIFWQANDVKLAIWVLVGIGATLVTLAALSRLLVYLLAPLRYRTNSILRFGLANLARAPRTTLIQLVGFGIGILAMLLLAVVRVDLISSWQRQLPPEAPNFFLINIQPDEVEAIGRFLSGAGVESSGVYPMQRGRLTHINDRPVSVNDYTEARAKRLVRREYNLSWSRELPDDNRVTFGRWWQGNTWDLPLFSVEQAWARTMGINPGDALRFSIAGQSATGRVSNFRSVQWDSFNPNFFVIGTPGLLRQHPATYITSFFLTPDRLGLTADLVKRFPSVTVIDIGAILGYVRSMMDQGAKAVEYVFVFTLATGLVVLIAGIQANRETRIQESVILRTLGLTRRQILLAAAAEFVTLGLLAGLLATAAASLIGFVLTEEIFQLAYRFNPWIGVMGVGGGILGIGSVGILATNRLLTTPPLQTLGQA